MTEKYIGINAALQNIPKYNNNFSSWFIINLTPLKNKQFSSTAQTDSSGLMAGGAGHKKAQMSCVVMLNFLMSVNIVSL